MVEALTSMVYPAIDGCNKDRLSYIYGLLSDRYLHLQDSTHQESIGYNASASYATLAHFCKILEQECSRVSFIWDLNFKKIAVVGGLNFKHFTQEICDHTNEFNLEALVDMVKTLVSCYTDPMADLIHWQVVHRYYVLTLMKSLESGAKPLLRQESIGVMIRQMRAEKALKLLATRRKITHSQCILYMHVLFNKLGTLSQYQDLLRIMDKSIGKPSGSLLISNEEGHSLIKTMLRSDNFMA